MGPDAVNGIASLERVAALIEFSEDAVIGLAPDGVITDWNPGAERLYGFTREEAIGASIGMLVPPERRGGPGGLMDTIRAGKAVRQEDTQRLTKDGSRVDVSISMAPIKDAGGDVIGAVAVTRDISQRVAAEERLRRSEGQLAEAQRLASVGSWEWDVTTDDVGWSAELYRILGHDPDRSAATYDAFIAAIHPADRELAASAITDTARTGAPLDFECRVVRRDHSERVVHIRGRTIPGDATRVVGTAQDVTSLADARQRLEAANRRNEALLDELRRLNDALADQARRDPLTGIGNRLRLDEDLAAYDARRVRYGHSYCVLLCDIDRFKALNDEQGHQAGDRVLCEVARTLNGQSRAGDGVYRYGGEEFLVLLAEQTVEGGAIAGERMRRAVEDAGLVTISVGIARCPQGESTDPADAIRRADRALYAAKAAGRNRVVADR